MLDFCTKYYQQNLQKKPKKLLRLGFLKLKDNADANKKQTNLKVHYNKGESIFTVNICCWYRCKSAIQLKIRKSFDDFRIYSTFIIKIQFLIYRQTP